jgi:hypothetical protein
MNIPVPIIFTTLMLCLLTCRLTAEVQEIVTRPTSDGELQFYGEDTGQPKQLRDLELSTKVGTFYGVKHSGILEFKLPEGAAKGELSRATLIVFLNGKLPNTGASVTIDVYAYYDQHANGWVEMEDNGAGEKAGVLVEKGVTGPLSPLNVTEVVRQALQMKRPWIGFRLAARDGDEKEKVEGLIIRTAEFAFKFPGNAPTIKLEWK